LQDAAVETSSWNSIVERRDSETGMKAGFSQDGGTIHFQLEMTPSERVYDTQ